MSTEQHITVAQAKRLRVIFMLATAVAFLVFGLIYAWSIFASPIGAAYGWEKGALQTTFNIALIAFCLAGALASKVNRLVGPKISILIAGIAMCLGFLGVALLADKSIVGIWISYGVLCGGGCGIGYIIALSVVNSWWGDRVGLSSGIMMMGFSFGSLILGSPANALMGSLGLKPVFIILAVLAIGVSVILTVLLRPAPAYIDELIPPASAKNTGEASPKGDNIFKTRDFYIYLIWAVFVISVGLTLIGGSKQGALAVGVAERLATLVVGLVSVMTGIARPIFGTICDKASLKVSMLLSAILTLAGALLLILAYSTNGGTAYIIGALAMGLGYGAIPVNASSFARERFGAADYTKNLGIINLSAAVGSFLSIGLVAAISPDGGSTNVTVWILFAVIAVVALVGGILFALTYQRGKKQQ